MAVTVPPEVNWLLDLLCGQDWPQGDEDKLRAASQAWMDAMLGIAGLADGADLTSQRVNANADSTSGDAFKSFWDTYLKSDTGLATGDGGVFGELFSQCEQQAIALVDQANEVEYTKLIIVFTLILVAIQIIWAIAAAIMTAGGSLAEIGLAMFFGRESILIALSRFLQMALTMLVPDLIAQTVMLAQGKGWDGSKTLSSAENALVGGLLGSFLGAGMSKLPWMGEDFAKTFGGKLAQGLSHFAEGGLVNDVTTLATVGTQYVWADMHGDKNTMAALSGELSAGNLFHQFLQGGALATAFYLPHLALPHGTPLTFTDAAGNQYQVVLSDKTLSNFNADENNLSGQNLTVFNDKGYGVGKVTLDGNTATIDYTFGGSKTIDLSDRGFTVGGHDGSLTTYGFDDQGHAQVASYVKPSDGSVTIPAGGHDVTVPDGSMVHYAADGTVFRADITDGSKVTTWQTDTPGQPLEVTGVTVHNTVPIATGVFGVRSSTVYGADGTSGDPVATTSWFSGHTSYGDAGVAGYHAAVGDHYSPFAPAGSGSSGGGPSSTPGLTSVNSPTSPAATGDLSTIPQGHNEDPSALAGGHVDPTLGQDGGSRQQNQDQPQVTVPIPVVIDPNLVTGHEGDGTVTERGPDTEAFAGTDNTITLALGDQPSDSQLLRDVLDRPKMPLPPTHEVDFDQDHFFIRQVRREAPGDGPADLQRHEQLEKARQRFLADHPGTGGAEELAQGIMPPWLEGDEPGKVLFVIDFWDRARGGIPVFNQELARAFAQAGHEVYVAVLDEHIDAGQEHPAPGITLFTSTAGLPAQVDLVIGHTRFTSLQAQEIRENFYEDAPLVHVQHMVPGGLGEVKAGTVIYRAPRVTDYDEVEITGELNGVTTGRIVQRDFSGDTGIARLEDQLVIDGKQVTVGQAVFKELGKGSVNNSVEGALEQKSDITIGVGPAITADARILTGGGATPLVHEVIPGLDFTRTVAQPPLDVSGLPADGQFNVLMIGRADDPQKGALEAAQMVGQLNARGLNVRLTIRGFDAGQADKIPAVEQQLSEAAGGAQVTVLPFTTKPDEIDADMSQAHLVIAPGSGEGFGMSAASAAAVGVPVLVPDGSGFGAFLADTRNVTVDTASMLVHQGFADQVPVGDWIDKAGNILEHLPQARDQAQELASELRDQGRTWNGTVKSVMDAMRDLYHARGHAAEQHPTSPVIEALKVEFVHPSDHLRTQITDGTRTIEVRIDQTAARLVLSTFDENGQVLRELAGRSHAQPGVFEVFSHADENGLVIDGMHVPFERLAEYLPELPDDAVIRLCGCDAASSTAIAELARVTGHDVLAADRTVWLDRNGNVFSASERDENGRAVPALDPDGRANGVWKVFHPDGTVADHGPDSQPVTYVPGDGVIKLGPGDVFNSSTIFGPRSAAELHLSRDVEDFAGPSEYAGSNPAQSAVSAVVPYDPAREMTVNVQLQHFAEDAIGNSEVRGIRDLAGGVQGFVDVLDSGVHSHEIAEQTQDGYKQAQQAKGRPVNPDTLARQVRLAPGRFREFGGLAHESAVMHDNEYLINAGTDRGESDPVSVRGIPVDIQYAKMMGGADPLPKPGYTMVRFPDGGSYPQELAAIEGFRQEFVRAGLGTAPDFDTRYAGAMLNLFKDTPVASAAAIADLPAAFQDPHVAELYKLAKDIFNPAEFAKFTARLRSNAIDAYSRTDVGKFIKQCASLGVCNIALEGARNPETFFTSLMTWNLVAGSRVSLPDAIGYFNVMGPSDAGAITDFANWIRLGEPSRLRPSGPRGWTIDPPSQYVNGIPDVPNSIRPAVEEFQRREREILAVYAESRGQLAGLNDAFFGPNPTHAAQQQQLRQLIDELITKDMGWPPSAVLFGELR